jgi:glycosyltransferase involved in cell wall biosynthesis
MNKKEQVINEYSFVVVGVTRNCEKTVKEEIKRINKALKDAKKINWIIIESDSSDNTVQKLKELQNELKNFYFESLGKLELKFKKRTERISYCRNQYVAKLRESPLYLGTDYVIVADLDGINSKITKEGIESSWLRKEWDMCAANQDGPYYDIWALRHKDWCANDCWAQYKFLNMYRNQIEENLWTSVYSKMIRINQDKEWIEVDSAFGGLAIYKKKNFTECEYNGITIEGDEVCEHIYFNKIYKEKGCKIFINPKLINSQITEHTMPLLWKNRIKNKIKEFVKKILK